MIINWSNRGNYYTDGWVIWRYFYISEYRLRGNQKNVSNIKGQTQAKNQFKGTQESGNFLTGKFKTT